MNEEHLSDGDLKRLGKEVDRILEENGIQPILDCKQCGGEMTLSIQPTWERPPQLAKISYNCHNFPCLAINVVWKAPWITK